MVWRKGGRAKRREKLTSGEVCFTSTYMAVRRIDYCEKMHFIVAKILMDMTVSDIFPV